MKRRNSTTKIQRTALRRAVLSACIGGALLSGAGVPTASAQDLAKENAELKARLDALEMAAKKEGILPSEGSSSKLVKAMSEITISGFVQASYFYNAESPDDGYSDAYLWNTKHNSFSLNKFKLTLASKPLETDEWDAGFKASLMFGEDAALLNSASRDTSGSTVVSDPSFQNVREAFVELNVPVGTGLNVKAGQLISLLNYESGDGGAANPNFSQGNQWWFTGNGPSAGVQASYNFTDKVALTGRIDNGLFQGPVDNNDGKAYSASLNLKPFNKFWVNIYGFLEDATGGTETKGVGTIGGYQVTEKLGTGFEFDYFNFDNPGGDVELWSIGGWAWYDFTPKTGLAFRADYVDSPDGPLGPAVRPNAGIGGPDTEGSLASFTLTFNWKPVPNVKIQPEIRYDTTTFDGGLDGEDDRFIFGAGITYMF